MGQPYDGTDLSTDPLSIREICRFPRASLRFSALSLRRQLRRVSAFV